MEGTARLMRRYPVHWDLVLGLVPAVGRGRRARVDELARKYTERLDPPAVVVGLENLPASPRLVLAANHYQRPGLWIMHPASVLTHAIARHYRLGNPPVRWLVTANWPPLRFGPFRVPNPGDWLLPRVAHAFWAYAVPFAGTNPTRTARSLRRLIEDARWLDRPIGLFPEGVAGLAAARHRTAAPAFGSRRPGCRSGSGQRTGRAHGSLRRADFV